MCFVMDYDWRAEVEEEGEDTNHDPKRKCMECNNPIAVGDRFYTLHQQEHEECTTCGDGNCLCLVGKCCECSKPTYGETFDYHCCQPCRKFLQAVEDAELAAGCRRSESRPYLCEMVMQISESGRDEAKKYFKHAAKAYPDLVSTGYLGKLWRRMFY